MGETRMGEADMTDYEALEREHLGDPDKRTGIYAPKQWRCTHDRTFGEACRQCDIARAKEVINQWGDEVDRARRIIGSRHLYDELLEGIDALQLMLRTGK
jgi:hypothetical protein